MSLDLLVRELAARGGVAYRDQLPVRKDALTGAVDAGLILRPRRGVYALAGADEALLLARMVRGARSHRSAALVHGWSVVSRPPRPELVVPRGRSARIPDGVDRRATIRWRLLSREEIDEACTCAIETVVDCLRDLPADEAVPVADSALRSGRVSVDELASALAVDHRRGSRSARTLVGSLSPFAESVLESRLRMLGESTPDVDLRSQVGICGPGWEARVDLADPDLGIVAEADGFAWHGDRAALRRDCLRYNRLTCAGWRVLRFSFEAVFRDPDHVRQSLHDVAGQQQRIREAGLTPWAASLRRP